jgi:hypothetical protein
LNDLGANFYCEDSHVGKVSRAEASLTKLQELNPYVSVSAISDAGALTDAIRSGNTHVLCQTEMMLKGMLIDPEALNAECRN